MHTTPDMDRADTMNHYITPIKKKKIEFHPELNYKQIENNQEEIRISSSTNKNKNSNNPNSNFYSINSSNNISSINSYNNSNNNNADYSNNNNSSQISNFLENKSFEFPRSSDNEQISSASKRYYSSPFSNFLAHSPVSFQNYLNSYSCESINVLLLKKKQQHGKIDAKQNNLPVSQNPSLTAALNVEYQSGIGINSFINEKECEYAKHRTPIKLNVNLNAENKFISPKSNDKSIFFTFIMNTYFYVSIFFRIFFIIE